MIPNKFHRKLSWALNLHEWGWKEDALRMVEEVAVHVSEEQQSGNETSEEREKETRNGREGFGFHV